MAWKAQYQRTLRALKRVKRPKKFEDDHFDDLVHFFMDCWHLKDWIAGDDQLPKATREAIVKAAEGNSLLQTCAAIANNTKHFNPSRKGKQVWILAPFEISTSDPKTKEVFSSVTVPHSVSVKGEGTKYAADLAADCVGEWKKILTANGLRVPTSLKYSGSARSL
jgi:hypothetical protein